MSTPSKRDKESFAAARARKEAALASLHELELREREGSLLDAGEVKSKLTQIGNQIRIAIEEAPIPEEVKATIFAKIEKMGEAWIAKAKAKANQ